MQWDNQFIHSSVMFGEYILEKVGLYEIIEDMEDYAMWMKVAKNYNVTNIPEFLITIYRAKDRKTSMYYLYKKRLRFQIQAIKNVGIYPETPLFVLRRLVAMALCKLGIK